MDDEEIVRNVLRAYLRSSGHTLVEAVDGQDALADDFFVVQQIRSDVLRLRQAEIIFQHDSSRFGSLDELSPRSFRRREFSLN